MTTNFVLRQPKATTKTPLYLRLTWKKHSMLFSTGIKIHPSSLLANNSKNLNSRISNTHSEADVLNNKINIKRKQVVDAFNAYVNKHGIEPHSTQFFRGFMKAEKERLAKEALEANRKSTDLMSLFETIAEGHDLRLRSLGKLISKNSVGASYRQTAKVLSEFEAEHFPYKLSFDRIDMEFYHDFVDYCSQIKMFSVNNTGKHIKNIKAIMREAYDEELTTNARFQSKRFKVLTEEVFNVYLTDDELNKIYNTTLERDHELVRDLFIIGCYTGLRISDFNRLTKKHITEDNNIKIRTQKTEHLVEIPLNQKLYDTLIKYDFSPPSIAPQRFNDLIKEICKEAGIDEIQTFEKTVQGKKVTINKPKFMLIASHTCRRTFATKYYNEGLDTITIMAMTGHKSEKSFLRYIKATSKDHAKRMRAHYARKGQHLKLA